MRGVGGLVLTLTATDGPSTDRQPGPTTPNGRRHRHDLSIHDAAYVGLADEFDAPLVTLDARIARSPGVRCAVETPPI